MSVIGFRTRPTDLEFNGRKISVKAWSVKERRSALSELKEYEKLDPLTQHDAVLNWFTANSDVTLTELESMDALEFDTFIIKLMKAITGGNSAPLVPTSA